MAFKIGCLHVVVWFLLCLNKRSDCCTQDSEDLGMRIFSKIIGGKPAELKQAKFMASLHYDPSDHPFGSGHFCGGSLISVEFVLTAAHCFHVFLNPKNRLQIADVRVYLGLLDRLVFDRNVLKYKIAKVYSHKDFSKKKMNNDIALLLLDSEAPKYHPYIKTINLGIAVPTPNCRIYGWGVSKYDQASDKRPGRLRFALVDIFSFVKCKKAYRSLMSSGMLCAGDWGGKTGACRGDSGGPLICNNTLVGITSWGIQCGTPNLPGMYTNVTHFKDWILHDYVKASSGSANAFYHSHLNTLKSNPNCVYIIALTTVRSEDLFKVWKYFTYYRT